MSTRRRYEKRLKGDEQGAGHLAVIHGHPAPGLEDRASAQEIPVSSARVRNLDDRGTRSQRRGTGPQREEYPFPALEHRTSAPGTPVPNAGTQDFDARNTRPQRPEYRTLTPETPVSSAGVQDLNAGDTRPRRWNTGPERLEHPFSRRRRPVETVDPGGSTTGDPAPGAQASGTLRTERRLFGAQSQVPIADSSSALLTNSPPFGHDAALAAAIGRGKE